MQINYLSDRGYKQIKEKFQISSLCAKVLASKNLSEDEINELLCAPKLSDPMSANGIQEAFQRIQRAKENKEKVMVCGDYDADGICATTILVHALKKYGINCGFYIPNRFKEGYGLHTQTVLRAKEKGYSLLITVDNGVKAIDALQTAKEEGIDVIVSDHHAMEEEIPCCCLLHPNTMGEQFSTLSGAGVALTLARALIGDDPDEIVFAGVASIGDVMEVKKETRAIIKLALKYLRQGLCLPIQLLANDRYPIWDETMISFQIVPKLNATGRLADLVNVNNTVRYLLLKKREDIQTMAKQINDLNTKRKSMSEDMVVLARSLIHEEYSFQLLFHESFHEGMVGLVAGKLQSELHQPVMVVAQNKDMYRGSIRSGNLLDLTTFFDDFKEELSAYGGHTGAAGIGFTYDKKQLLQDYVNKRMDAIELLDEHKYDVIELDANQISIEEVLSLQALAPFGNGFEEPIFFLSNTPVQELKMLSKGKHAKWILNDFMEAMYFNCPFKEHDFKSSKTMSFVGNLRINTFMKKKKVNIFLLDCE